MPTKLSAGCAVFIALCASADAAEITIRITDQNGLPAANAVVTFLPNGGGPASTASAPLVAERLVDQRDETFLPLVTVIPRGGVVRFANSDAPLHQVYSFSPIKQFELTLAPGETSDAVAFDEAGVAAVGCNIHDHMIAYVFVTDSAWTAITDASGTARIEDIPAGNYTAEIWHPRIPPATDAPRGELAVADPRTTFEGSVSLLADPRSHRTHGGRY